MYQALTEPPTACQWGSTLGTNFKLIQLEFANIELVTYAPFDTLQRLITQWLNEWLPLVEEVAPRRQNDVQVRGIFYDVREDWR